MYYSRMKRNFKQIQNRRTKLQKNKRNKRNPNNQDQNTIQTNRPVFKLNDDLRTKWFVNGRTSTNVTTATYLLDVAPALNQGIGADKRIGDVVNWKSVAMTYSWTYGDPSNVCRLMIFYAFGPPQAWTAGDFLDSGPSGVPDVYSQAYPYLRNRRYMVLYDRTDVVNNSTTQQITHEINVPINCQTVYVYGTNTVASGSLVFVAITDSSLAPNPLLIMNPRFSFRDF